MDIYFDAGESDMTGGADGIRSGSSPESARNTTNQITSERYDNMSSNRKTVVFSLQMPKTEIPFATLETTLKRFGKMRADFESLGLRVEVVNFRK